MSDGMTDSMPKRVCPECGRERYSIPCYDGCESRAPSVYHFEFVKREWPDGYPKEFARAR